MKDKSHSPTLDKILQGAKFRMCKEWDRQFYYQVQLQEYGAEVMRYYLSSGQEYGCQGFVDEFRTNGNTLVVVMPILTKSGIVEINTEEEVELIEA